MKGFEHILHWKLRRGSHQFPGKDGGTCINEAALVAAGFEYRPIRDAAEMPGCFSRPICQLAMLLNDDANESDRQRLLPFVTRLACADTEEVERQRRLYIASRVSRFMSTARGIQILEGALAIGRQADRLPEPTVEARMAAVKDQANAISLPEVTPVLAKMKGWLTSVTSAI